MTEGPAPAELAGNAVTVLQIYGNMTFAGPETVEAKLPPVKTAERPVVILRLRAQEGIGSSFIAVLERYCAAAHGAGRQADGRRRPSQGQGATGSHRDHQRDPGSGKCLCGDAHPRRQHAGRTTPPHNPGSKQRKQGQTLPLAKLRRKLRNLPPHPQRMQYQQKPQLVDQSQPLG